MPRALSLVIAMFAAFLVGRVSSSFGLARALDSPQLSPAIDERFCADANGDGTVDISDPVMILNGLFTSFGRAP